MLQIIVFALIIGVILAKLGERAETVANFFSQFNDIMMEMTMMIMALAPIGVFCLISRTFANIGFSAFVPLAKYMIGVLIALAIQCFGVYQILLKIFTGLNPLNVESFQSPSTKKVYLTDLMQPDEKESKIVIEYFDPGRTKEIINVAELSEDFSGHGGGDNRMVEEFLDIISGEKSESTYITSLDRSLQSHYCALAAEYSRLHDGKPVDIETFR